jgi:hypothetical protein
MRTSLPLRLLLFLMFISILPSFAQISGEVDKMNTEFVVDENMLMETSWRYAQTTHASSGEAIHTADDNYDYYLNLKFDYTYQYYLNGKRSKGTWLLNDESNELYYNFRNIKWWKIVELSDKELVLEFSIGKGVFHYKFNKVDYKDTPFQKAANELPLVKKTGKRKRRLLGKRKKRRPKKKLISKKKKKEELIPIEVQMMGGGFYGGLNPMVKDYVVIKTNGRCIKEQESLQDGNVKITKDIPRATLEKFAKFAEEKKFFDMDRTYDCISGNCMKRKRKKPTPIPLRLSIRYGDKYHIVIISIYGQDEDSRGNNYVKYPKELDLIIDGLRRMVGT